MLAGGQVALPTWEVEHCTEAPGIWTARAALSACCNWVARPLTVCGIGLFFGKTVTVTGNGDGAGEGELMLKSRPKSA